MEDLSMYSRRELVKCALLAPFATQVDGSLGTAPQSKNVSQSKWLKDIAKQLQVEFGLPAVWVAVNTADKIEAAVVGVRKAGDPARAALEDRLTVASISKPMAGLWMATLVEKGKLSYSAKAVDILPEFREVCLEEHRDITLGQLLTHTAGVIRDVATLRDHLALKDFPADRLRQAREVLTMPSPPNSKGKEVYSNNGVTLAATMAERVAGEPYEVAASRFYRSRCGLDSWGVWPMDLHDDADKPWPHTMKAKTPTPQPPQSVQFQFVRPSGGAHCTILDLVRFGRIATNSVRLSRLLLKPETWTATMAPVPETSATLTSFHAYGERAFFGHAGSLGTTSSNLVVFPEWETSIAVHTNASGDEFRDRGIQLIQDAVRKRRAERNPPPPCAIGLTRVATVDSTWTKEIIPSASEDRIRIKVNFEIKADDRTGDLQTLVKLGDVERRDDRFHGLVAGNHVLHFEFEMPQSKMMRTVIKVDALATAGNQTPMATSFEMILNLN